MTENETTHARAQQEMIFRGASRHDVEAIAALHAESWQRHYRGAFLDSFLDGDVIADRLAVWQDRLMAPSATHFTIGAFQSDALVGFVHMIPDEDPHWGTLLDNLHVTYELKRQGIGRRLLTEAARELVRRRPADRQFYLWVLAQNTAAQAFYVACGGTSVETTLREPFPGGGRALNHRIAWPEAAVLVSTLWRGRLSGARCSVINHFDYFGALINCERL